MPAPERMRHVLHTILAALCAALVLGSTFAAADAEARSTTYALDIPAQDLNAALQALALASQHKLLYRSELVEGKTSPALKGSFTPRQAIEALLEGSDLTFEITPSAVVLIRAKGSERADGTMRAGAPGASPFDALSTALEGRNIRLAQAGTTNSSSSSATANENTETPASQELPAPEETDRAIPEVLVLGSKSLNSDIQRTEDDIQPYVVFDRGDIDQSGALNLEDFFRGRLTMNVNSMLASQQPGFASSGNTTVIDLRGLGADETLILIDGRRVAGWSQGGSPQQPDLNAIPLNAIERIEVLPTTASGIYGGGATGGVINVVLRRDYSGVQVEGEYRNTVDSDFTSTRLALSAGLELEGGRTSVLFAASRMDSNQLLIAERDFYQRARRHILSNNPSFFLNSAIPPLGHTTNIRSTSGANLTLKPQFGGAALGSPITHVPIGYTGPASDSGAGLVANAGQYNFDLANTAQTAGLRAGLANEPTVESIMLTVRREFTSRVSAFLDVGGSENSSEFAATGVNNTFTLPATAPANPFNEQVRVSTPTFGADLGAVTTHKNLHAAAGLIVNLPFDWRGEVDYAYSKNTYSSNVPLGSVTASGRTAVNNGVINVFQDTNLFPVDFSPYIGTRFIFPSQDTTQHDYSMRVAGPLPVPLPGGAPTLSLLAEHRKDLLEENSFFVSFGVFTPGRSQSVDSVYGELALPFLSPDNNVPFASELTVQLAGRWDEYTVHSTDPTSVNLPIAPGTTIDEVTSTMSSTDPTLGIRWRPIRDVALRASYGTGFLPPAVTQITPAPPLTVVAGSTALTDPRRGGEPLGDVILTQGGNPDLRPEQSESWSAGFILTPHLVSGLRLSADWTRIDKTDNISALSALEQSVFDNEAYVPGLIVRGPVPPGESVGPVVGLSSQLLNFARTKVEALDLALDYELRTTSLGSFRLSASATKLLDHTDQITPIAPLVDTVGLAEGLEWRANATVTWDYRNWTLGWFSQYFDSYALNAQRAVDPNQGAATIESQIYHDVVGRYRFGASQGLLAETEVSFGIRNVLNADPPVDVTLIVPGYSRFGDPRLATYYLTIKKGFSGK